MASENQLMMAKVKIEIDMDEEPASSWESQHQCSGTPNDWSENSLSSTISSCETDGWNSSATTLNGDPVSQPTSDQEIKVEPIDYSMTGDGLHQFHSADNREGKVNIKCEPDTYDDFYFLPLDPESVVNQSSDNRDGKVDFKCDFTCEPGTSDDFSSSPLEPKNVVKRENSGSEDSDSGPAFLNRNTKRKRTPHPWGIYTTSLYKSAITSSVQQPKNRSFSASFMLFNSFKQHMASAYGENMQHMLPMPSAPEDYDAGYFGNMDVESNGDERKTVESGKNQASISEMNMADMEKRSKQHVCDVCNKAFTRAGHLKTHKLIHTGDKQFVCNVCGKAFTEAGNLRRHKLIHTGDKQFACDECDRAFTRAGDLKAHKLIHSGHKQFVCDVCSKAFTRSTDLKRHKLIHAGHKPFVCDVCSKAFTQASHLKMHKLTHSDCKQFVCDVCNRAFTTTRNLKKHKLNVGHMVCL